MARLVLYVLALCAVGAYASSNDVPKQNEYELYLPKFFKLFQDVNEPSPPEIQQDAIDFGGFVNNYDKFENVTAAKTYNTMINEGWLLPRGQPFSLDEPAHVFEIITLFNALSTTKDFKTLYGTAAYLRDLINEGIFIYTLSVTVLYNKHAEGISLSPIFEIFPNYFHKAETMAIIGRLSAHKQQYIQKYPNTFKLGGDDKIVINTSSTYWPYKNDKNFALSYFTEDIGLNAAYYTRSLIFPYWMNGATLRLQGKELQIQRGDIFWLTCKQFVARYYMERLSNGLGEIPDIVDVIEDGFDSGLLHFNGVPLPSRPNNYRLDQPQLAGALEKVLEFERRIWEAIDQGFYINRDGEHVSLLNENGLHVLGNLIESNDDSPNRYYYKDFIRLWKQILGNNVKSNYQYENRFTPLTNPSVLEKYETSIRDPAFYMLYKRVLNLFVNWQKQMPLYKPEELSFAGVEIEKIETDKLVTLFEPILINATQALYRNVKGQALEDKSLDVYVQYEQLTHKPFSIKIKVKSDSEKHVIVKLFLAPKYDSKGLEIPLHYNTENFYLLHFFTYSLPAGESVITHEFVAGRYDTIENYKILKNIASFPENLTLPKGKVGGQVFQLIAYIQDNLTESKRNIMYPSDRPLHSYQLLNVKNIRIEDIKIFHEE